MANAFPKSQLIIRANCSIEIFQNKMIVFTWMNVFASILIYQIDTVVWIKYLYEKLNMKKNFSSIKFNHFDWFLLHSAYKWVYVYV